MRYLRKPTQWKLKDGKRYKKSKSKKRKGKGNFLKP